MSSAPLIAILTDFGDLDPYVGIMKGVISKIATGIPVVDITHKIPPGDIRRAAINLWQAHMFFPMRTVFLTVVDPGVGSSRRGIIAEKGSWIFVGPDNGVFSFVLDSMFRSWELTNTEFQLTEKSATFHGRDIFAPAAAYAAKGVPGPDFGSPVDELVQLPDPVMQFKENQLMGEILLSDQFGNLLTSIGRFKIIAAANCEFSPWLSTGSHLTEKIVFDMSHANLILPGGQILKWYGTFADIAPGSCGVLIGSNGLLEIAANGDSAAEMLKLSEGDLISLEF